MHINKRIFSLLLIISFLGFNSYAQDKVVDQIIAIVGSNIILKSDIESLYLQNQAQGVTTDGDMKCEILENLLINKLLVSEAELDTTIIITDNQVNQELDRRIQYYIQHLGSEKAIEKHFGKPLIELKSQLQDVIRDDILSGQMRSKIIENIKIAPSEVRYFYKNLDNKEKPVIQTQYEYAQITIIPEIIEEEENRIKEQLRNLKKRVEEGENFSTFAVFYSEGPSASSGGDLGYFGRAEMDPAFSQAAFNLEPGEVSNVVQSEFGFHIIQMIDRKGEKVRCKHVLMKPKIKAEELEKAETKLDSLANAIRKEEIKFDEAAMRYSMDKDSRNNGGLVINPKTLSSKFTPEELSPEVSKVLPNLNINEISKPFIAIDNKQRKVINIVKLIDKSDEHLASIQEDYQVVSDLYLNKKQEEAVKKWIGERQSKTYISIDPTYQNCNFDFKNWIK